MMYSPLFYGYTARSAGSRTTHGVVGARSCAGDGAEKVCHFKGSKTRLLGRKDRGCSRAQGLLSDCFPDVVLDATKERIRDEKCSLGGYCLFFVLPYISEPFSLFAAFQQLPISPEFKHSNPSDANYAVERRLGVGLPPEDTILFPAAI
jgi:hypothetical protein